MKGAGGKKRNGETEGGGGGEREEGRTKQRGRRKECVKLHDSVGRDRYEILQQ